MQCSTFKIATCETFLKITKISIIKKKNYASSKTNPKIKTIYDRVLHLLHQCTKFQSPRSNNNLFSRTRSP